MGEEEGEKPEAFGPVGLVCFWLRDPAAVVGSICPSRSLGARPRKSSRMRRVGAMCEVDVSDALAVTCQQPLPGRGINLVGLVGEKQNTGCLAAREDGECSMGGAGPRQF